MNWQQCVIRRRSDSSTKCLFCSLLSRGSMFLTKNCNTRDTQGAEAMRSAEEPEFSPFQFAVSMSLTLAVLVCVCVCVCEQSPLRQRRCVLYVCKTVAAQRPDPAGKKTSSMKNWASFKPFKVFLYNQCWTSYSEKVKSYLSLIIPFKNNTFTLLTTLYQK